MTQITPTQIGFIIILTVVLLLVVPVLQRHTGKDATELLFGIKRKNASRAQVPAPKKEPHISNGTKGELTAFVSQVLKYASRNGMNLVAPGTVEYQGKKARLTALLVAPGGITGIYCLGFGGTISPYNTSAPASLSRPWKQHANGQDTTFENPLKVCQEQYEIVHGALEDAGIMTDLKIVTVFTNPRASLISAPDSVFTKKAFINALYDDKEMKKGSLDSHKVALMLADLAGVKAKSQKK